MRNEYNIGVAASQQGFPYVTVMEEALPAQFCIKLIEKFELNASKEQVLTTGTMSMPRNFMEVNISQHWEREHEIFVNAVQQSWKMYMVANHIQFDVQWPRQFGYEQFRMKRYLPNEKDQFALHTDVGNYASARRFVSFLWYLNTVEEGGATQFGFENDKPLVTIPAVRSRLLMFPPLWTHPHWGCKTVKGPKYIVSGYLHLI